MFNILFILRIDAKEKNGDDLFQAKQYKKILEKYFSHHINIQFAHNLTNKELKNTDWNLIQLFNISRLDEHIFYLKNITYQHIVMTPIVQPEYRFNFKDYIKTFIRGALKFKYIPYNSLKVKYDLLSQCLFNVYLSRSEQNYYEKYFVKLPNNILAHNGIDKEKTILSKEEDSKKIDFLIVGRVEKSKNTLNTIKLMNKYFPTRKITIIGAGNKYHFTYFKKFLKECEQNSNIDYIGPKKHSEVLTLMSNAKILLNLSLKEVSPLVDLEALAYNMKVLSTTASFTHLTEDSCFMRVSPIDKNAIIEKINMILKSHCNTKKEKQIQTWDETLRTYIEEIEKIINKETI